MKKVKRVRHNARGLRHAAAQQLRQLRGLARAQIVAGYPVLSTPRTLTRGEINGVVMAISGGRRYAHLGPWMYDGEEG